MIDRRPGPISGTPATRDRFSSRTIWISILLWLSVTSVGLTSWLEWDVYRDVLGLQGARVAFGDEFAIRWLLIAKSLTLALPMLAVVAMLLRAGFKWSQWVFVGVWTAFLYWLTADLILMSFSGLHVLDYLPYLQEYSLSPDHWQWAGEGIFRRAVHVLAAVSVAGVGTFALVRWVVGKMVKACSWSRSNPIIITLTAIVVAVSLAASPAACVLSNESRVSQVCAALPVEGEFLRDCADYTSKLVRSFRQFSSPTEELDYLVIRTPGSTVTRMIPIRKGEGDQEVANRQLLVQNQTNSDIDLEGWTLQDETGGRTRLAGVLHSLQAARAALPKNVAPNEPFLLIDPAGQLRYLLHAKSTPLGMRLELTQEQRDQPNLVAVNVEQAQADLDPRIFEDCIDPKPVDPNAVVSKGHRPNVVLIMLESFRHSAVSQNLMKALDQLSRKGLRLHRHYSGSNCSHLGIFSLFYGRESVAYRSTSEMGIPPQLLESLRRSGYQLSYVTCGELKGFFGLDRFLGDDSFDKLIPAGTCVREFDPKPRAVQTDFRYGFKDWPDTDISKLAKVRNILNAPSEQPHFIFTFLMSTHFPYAFPPRFAINQPCRQDTLDYWGFRHGDADTVNRYKNAALFLEDEVMKFIRSLDLERTMVIITGDHGESMGEDRAWSHASRLSDIQTRVPFIMLGGGVPPREVFTPTSHVDVVPTLLHALEGKPVPIANCHGKDALSDSSARETVLLTPPDGPQSHKVVIVRGESRLVFKANFTQKKVDAVGLCGTLDDTGQMTFKPNRAH